VGEIDRIAQISQINQALSSVQRTGDGARKQHQEQEEKPKPHDEIELTNEVSVEELLKEELPKPEDPPSLDLAV
jgi:hypothetical protein